ncbi:phospholipase D-like domain-containing protein [Telluria sp. B2]
MTNKRIAQLVTQDGKAIAAATSAPGCFIHDGVPIAKHPDMSWGSAFSEPSSGNKVDFYVTGEEYFSAVAAAIESAKKSIYIAGWQVNFDVELAGGKTLFQYLEKAIDQKPLLRIYVMPWLSPKVGVDTGDFETMLAVFQLNAGLNSAPRAFALPAIAQSDMKGVLGIGFSHHQKLVVIDEERAFVGGIDLAYGRRDDGKFSLAANGRTGNELYNTCIPPIHTLSKVDQVHYLTRAELFCACFDGTVGSTAAWASSAPAKPIAMVQDAISSFSSSVRDVRKVVSDWWATGDVVPEFVRKMQDIPVDAAQEVSRWAYRRIDRELKGKLEGLRETGGAYAANTAAVLLAWLNNASLEQLPAELRGGSIKLIETFMLATLAQLSQSANKRRQRYANLQKLRKIVPASGKTISSAQPRMPWHDVHSSITGPAVSDLCRNFVCRWNGIACRYERSYARMTVPQEAKPLFDALGLKPLAQFRIPRLAAPPPKAAQVKAGKSWVQVLRSASVTMQGDESAVESKGKAGKTVHHPQNDCLKAMLTAIHGAQKFIYIEGQFFQSAYGADEVDQQDGKASGPMSILTKVTSLAGYEKYAKRLGIDGVSLEEISNKIDLSQIDDVKRDANGQGAAFLRDLDVVLKNVAAIKASNMMGKPQEGMVNPIGEALARRIEDAIHDDMPFHVYLVLPVHPEGTLNTINIMTQLHITMQSLVFGNESLVNRIRRAMLIARLRKIKRISKAESVGLVKNYELKDVINKIGDGWSEYLTLLNLRTWEILGKRPVTEQVYVHSKLLISDDRVAILGSANINDRSHLGSRDSELAVIIRDDERINVKLDGVNQYPVSVNVHYLRVRLWKKLFGLMGGAGPADKLLGVLDKPAARETWEAIQRTAHVNALAYQNVFPFLARVQGEPSSIWPTWDKEGRRLKGHMPFNERFWRSDEVMDAPRSWEAKNRQTERSPIGIQGFIVTLPVTWTAGENNMSGMNLTLLADNRSESDAEQLADQSVSKEWLKGWS